MPLITRRSMIAGCGALMTAGPLAASAGLLSKPPGKSLGFRVIRQGSEIGTHALTFDGDDRNLTVRVAVDLSVGIGPISLFRYTHRAQERWRNAQLYTLDSQTNDDGTPCAVTGRRSDLGFVVEGTKATRYIAPEDALPATHWNRRMLDGPMINTQDGQLMRPEIIALGTDSIPGADGDRITASHFEMRGDARLDIWYDTTPNWAGISFKAGDGSLVRYERI